MPCTDDGKIVVCFTISAAGEEPDMKILIVDDDANAQNVFQLTFESAAFEVARCEKKICFSGNFRLSSSVRGRLHL